MGKSIKITIKGTDNHGDDAPRVEDLFAQVLDQVKILQELENVVAGKVSDVLEWRVKKITKNSPSAIELVPCAKDGIANIEAIADKVVSKMASGLQELERGKRPEYFNDNILKTIKTTNERVTNGLASTEIEFSGYEDAPGLSIKPRGALLTIGNIKNFRTIIAEDYRELGSVEGYVQHVGRKSGRPFIILTTRLDNKTVKCTGEDSEFGTIGNLAVKEVIEGLRIRVHGVLHYKALGDISRVDFTRLELFPDPATLPTIEDLIDPDFTNGVDSVEYIRKIRDNG